jgi:hypothetical protein
MSKFGPFEEHIRCSQAQTYSRGRNGEFILAGFDSKESLLETSISPLRQMELGGLNLAIPSVSSFDMDKGRRNISTSLF